MSHTTIDRVARGALMLEQPSKGYRYTADALLLAGFAARHVMSIAACELVDLGAGVGVVGLLLASRANTSTTTLVEIQPELAALCERNAQRNALQVTVRCEDLRDGHWRGAVQRPCLLLCNPPFFRVGEGRLSPDPQVAQARHELSLTLDDLLDTVAPLLVDADSRLALIYPATRADELGAALTARSLAPRVRRDVLPFPGAPASRVLQAIGSHGDTRLLDPLCERDVDGRLTPERDNPLGNNPRA